MEKQLVMSWWDKCKRWLSEALDSVSEITTRIAKILKDWGLCS